MMATEIKKIKIKKLSNSDFEKIITQYRDRYGEKHMSFETATMWYQKLSERDSDQVVTAFEKLVGEKQFHFGWSDVIDKIDLIFSRPNYIETVSDVWKKNHNPTSQQSDFQKSKKITDKVKELDRQVDRGEIDGGEAHALFYKFVDQMDFARNVQASKDILENNWLKWWRKGIPAFPLDTSKIVKPWKVK